MHSSNTRLSKHVQKPASTGAVLLALVSVATQMIALAAATGWTTSAHSSVSSSMASALIRSLHCGGAAATLPSPCPTAATGTTPQLAGDSHEHVAVPTGGKQCPDSPAGVSCAGTRSVNYDVGDSAVPEGQPACPVDPTKALNVPGSCNVAATPAPAAPAASTAPATTPVTPDVKAPHSPNPDAQTKPSLTLTSTDTSITAGNVVFLDAKSPLDVSGTPYAIEIFDTSTGALIAACTETSECQVSYSAKSGTHSFVAYVVAPTTSAPKSGIQLTSNTVTVRFLGVSLQLQGAPVVAPGQAVTFVATATQDVTNSGFVIDLHDADTGARFAYCRHGIACSMSLIEPAGGVHTVIATLSPSTPADLAASPDVHAASSPVSATWLAVDLNAAIHGGAVSLSATANADLSQTPYSIYFFDGAGGQVGSPCHAQTCTARAPVGAGAAQTYTAVIGNVPTAGSAHTPLTSVLSRVPVAPNRLDVQAASRSVKPNHMLWGVDSCQEMTDDPAGTTGLLPQVTSILGAPDFWARYLPNTTYCGGLNGNEIAAARSRHMGILPIYNDYDCSAVSGNANGAMYGEGALQWLQNDLIPQGTAVAIDIEPPGPACPGAANVDASFIAGWYDVISKAGYVPVYYGNTSPGSDFANAWCSAVQQRVEIGNNSILWSFEPSLGGTYGRGNAPAFGPYSTGCAGHYLAWQFVLSAGSTPDVDQDELSSDVPLWYP